MTDRSAMGPPEGAVVMDRTIRARQLAKMRADVALLVLRLGLSPGRLGHLLVVVNELASNAITHAGGVGQVRVWRTGDRMYCEVRDTGPGFAAEQTQSETPGIYAPQGRGLAISRSFSDELVVRSGPDGTTVTAAFELESSADEPWAQDRHP